MNMSEKLNTAFNDFVVLCGIKITDCIEKVTGKESQII